jgi:DNA-binding response OmpR family regulator
MNHDLILFVGSDGNAGALKELAVGAGYDFSTVQSQDEGLRLAQNGGVDVLIVEAETADLGCCGALVALKAFPLASRPRLILLTGGTAADRARGLEGADDVLPANWEPTELLSRQCDSGEGGRGSAHRYWPLGSCTEEDS